MEEAALRSRRRAEQTAAGLPPLLVAAQRVAATVLQGVHGRRQAGPGETFWQFRRYQPGDPAALIDWRQSAKSQPVYIREQEWEAAQSVWLWRDGSASMHYRSKGIADTKGARAEILLLAVAALMLRAGEQVALLGLGRTPVRGTAALSRLADNLVLTNGAAADGDGLPGRAFLPRNAQIVLIGDFLAPLDQTDAVVKWFVGAGINGHMLQVLDPAEETLPFTGRARFTGLEAEGSTVIGRVDSVRGDYTARLAAHRDGLVTIARSAGWSFLSHRTDHPPEAALLALYLALSGHFGRRR
ncbi:MAG: DUF58 domain-containing protein [Alphaproteobacteria bacterium]|jgi:uncharacterized protein (DUF58 family)|nr:DUF58 domain-containing protein [Alphaproteobacteria bacterium]MDP6518036.1 DUF58 domain-containing protein [Alphaproteobacteria bacterium]